MMSSPTYVSKSFMLRLRIIARQFVQFSRQRVVLWQPRDRGMHGEYAGFYNLLPTPPPPPLPNFSPPGSFESLPRIFDSRHSQPSPVGVEWRFSGRTKMEKAGVRAELTTRCLSSAKLKSTDSVNPRALASTPL
jgi:hypothetical protein